ncbi:peptidoglycan editing factor PgeF [Saxibacter everestensis]|uniref:Purine nucleoside phosphorylase n=1 Tax=Saxibacter everestensis TaxID=2909229 RepID=A0ABY8QY72_9MICO|nr:peptidoglycan editing factor PgeF [Brevibacteriaceae bacterium ZFBP1038]
MLSYRHVLRAAGAPTEVHAAFTDRRGGYSSAPYSSFNLATHVGDRPDDVSANRSALAIVTGLPTSSLVFMDQVHGRAVHLVDERHREGEAPVADALVTSRPGIALAVMVADCVPVLLADPAAGVIGAVHAGRPGMIAGVVPAAVSAMRELGAERIEAVVGPSVCPRCYEVPAEMRAAAAQVAPVSASVTRTGTPAIDVAAGVVWQLHEAAVDVRWLDGCTRERDDLYSYRRDSRTGRFAGLVWIDPDSAVRP